MSICRPTMLVAAAALLLGTASGHAAEPLPALGVDVSKTSVSGISSGAYMAGQFHLAFSTTVVGAGVVAGGPWGCASNGSGDALLLGGFDNVARALTGCMQVTGGAPDGGELAEAATALRQAGAAPGLFVAATHGLFVADAWARLAQAGITRVWVSDTVDYGTHGRPELQVVSTAPLIGAALQRIVAFDDAAKEGRDRRA